VKDAILHDTARFTKYPMRRRTSKLNYKQEA